MDVKLKQCPFCGGKAEFFEDEFFCRYSVVCTECGAGTDTYCVERDAIDAWNRRVENQPNKKDKLAPLSKWNEVDAVTKEHSQDGLTFTIVYNDATGHWRSYCKTKDSGYEIGRYYTSEANAYESCLDVYEEYYGTQK